MTVNKYGHKMRGLRKASGNTVDNPGKNCYYQVFYNKATGDVWVTDHCSIGQNSWTVYRDSDVVSLGFIVGHATMQDLADIIHRYLAMED